MFKKIVEKVLSAKSLFSAFVVAGLVSLSAAPSFAALTLTGITVDTTDYITIATFLITALVAFWGIKKGLALLGR